ncbi:hypothetical protein PAWBP_2970 [Paulownia witches'-broom phytoplasma]|nr:hypothetical protein PAWBP_2970 [Paulownia witches'-broom phytoplasma]
MDNNKTKIKEIKENLDKNTENITILKGKLIQLEKEKEAKEKEIKQKQEEQNLASPDDKTRLQAEIGKLQDETLEIVGKIGEIKVQIKNLQTDQEYYQDMLSSAENYKRILEERYEDLTEGDKKLFKEIQSVEERRAKIQKEIDKVNEKLEEIRAEQELYKA